MLVQYLGENEINIYLHAFVILISSRQSCRTEGAHLASRADVSLVHVEQYSSVQVGLMTSAELLLVQGTTCCADGEYNLAFKSQDIGLVTVLNPEWIL